MAEYTLRVMRFDPGRDPAPCEEAWTSAEIAGLTVLEALDAMREATGGTLAFRRSCRSGICGACAMTIQGHAALACEVRVAAAADADGAVRVAPLRAFPVLRDLVVDLDPFFAALGRATPRLVGRPDHDGRMSPAATEALHDVASCVLCGVCDAEMRPPAGAWDRLGPAALAKTYRFAADPRDALGPARAAIARDNGLAAMPADPPEVCPKSVRFGPAFAALRRMAAGGVGPGEDTHRADAEGRGAGA